LPVAQVSVKKILPAVHRFLPTTHKNLACGPKLTPRSLQQARHGICSICLKLFKGSVSHSLRDALLLTNSESIVGMTVTVESKQIKGKSPSSAPVRMWKQCQPHSDYTHVTLYIQTRQSARFGAVTTVFDKDGQIMWVWKHFFLKEGVTSACSKPKQGKTAPSMGFVVGL